MLPDAQSSSYSVPILTTRELLELITRQRYCRFMQHNRTRQGLQLVCLRVPLILTQRTDAHAGCPERGRQVWQKLRGLLRRGLLRRGLLRRGLLRRRLRRSDRKGK